MYTPKIPKENFYVYIWEMYGYFNILIHNTTATYDIYYVRKI